MIFRPASPADCEQIALLHADSWRRTYRGLFDDHFLDNRADEDRLRTWSLRLDQAPADLGVIVAEHNETLQGFICIFAAEDPRWGSLIDNLHVRHDVWRRGIGGGLMANAFDWLVKNAPDCGVYLWVMENNDNARRFYLKRGARDAGVIDKPNPVGGGSARNCRYVWSSPFQLQNYHSDLG